MGAKTVVIAGPTKVIIPDSVIGGSPMTVLTRSVLVCGVAIPLAVTSGSVKHTVTVTLVVD